jgi:hypothetical protein
MSVLLIILQIIGAMPAIIELVKKIYNYIQGMRGVGNRMRYRAKLWQVVFSRRHKRKMTASENAEMETELAELCREVELFVNNQK